MKCISLWQPHASLIAIGEKHYETRTWSTRYRGPIAIHAGKSQDEIKHIWQSIQHAKKTDWQHAREFTRAIYDAFKELMAREGMLSFNFRDLPYGAIVATAELTAVYDTVALYPKLTGRVQQFGDFGHGRYAWRLEDVQPLKTPMPYRGQQGLWDLPTDVVAQIESVRL